MTTHKPIFALGLLCFGFATLCPGSKASDVDAETGSAKAITGESLENRLPDQVSFNAHIRPVMSNTCFACHGPDEEDNESGFRIDSSESATSALPSDDEQFGIVPGKPMESEVYLRLIDQGAGEQMPPGDFRHQLSAYEKALFRKWIEQGAEYEEHWSYAPVRRTEPPAVAKSEAVANPIDAFVLARLQAEGIAPSPLADRATLLRRLSLDLIGLPPTPEQLQNFLDDDSQDAYKKQVERLLASKHFGERMASPWLDAVRFADTVGYHGDQNLRNAAYRTYVIDSFNQNKPFDQFTREQLAGDLLPNPTEEQLTATGMLRLNMVTREGGAQPGEYLAKYKADRVRTLGTAFLGSTLACCECHNHKYDPFSIKDFYSFGAFFDDIRQWGVYSNYGYTPNPDLRGFNNNYPFPPEMRVDSEAVSKEIRFLCRERDLAAASQMGTQVQQTDNYRVWERRLLGFLRQHPTGFASTVPERMTSSGATELETLADGSVLLKGKPVGGETLTFGVSAPENPDALPWVALRLEALPDETHAGNVGRSEDGRFSLQLKARVVELESGDPVMVPNRPRFVRVEAHKSQKILSLAELQVFGSDENGERTNLALSGTARHSSEYSSGPAKLAIDGNTDGRYHEAKSTTHTSGKENGPWWEVDLGLACDVQEIVLWNRTDGDYQQRLDQCRLVLLDENRRELYSVKPKTPRPSTSVKVPAEVVPESAREWKIAWAEADRNVPESYSNGRPPREIKKTWRSGPDRWQLPTNEQQLPHTAIFHFEQPLALGENQQLELTVTSSDVGRLRFSFTPLGHAIAGWEFAEEGLSEALTASAGERSEAQSAHLIAAFDRSTKAVHEQTQANQQYRSKILDLKSGKTMTLVVQQLPNDQVPDSRVLPRGNWQDTSGEPAPPSFPEFLPGEEFESSRRLTRLDLANWLVSPDNPLTSRHFTNRLWKQFFGAGLSGKLDDLGNQGEWPSHPMLLDWLASEFVQSGWDVKHLVRQIVHSRTYRQAAGVRPDLADIDPYNRLLAQQAPRRLEAEVIRDNALAISGLLRAGFVGGSSVFPYQPDGHYSNLQFPNRRYQSTTDSRQYRRSVYMHWQRTFLHPMLVNFDAPSRDECTADRSLSNSPQQALTLLNDPQFVEASVAMAKRLQAESEEDSLRGQLELGFRLALARPPTEDEQRHLTQLFDSQLEYFRNEPADALVALRVGLQPQPDSENAAELAALAQVCRVLLNLHETITRY